MAQVPFSLEKRLDIPGIDVPVPQVPEIFPGFGAQFRFEEARFAETGREISRTQQRQQELIQRVSTADISRQSVAASEAMGAAMAGAPITGLRRLSGIEQAALDQNEADRAAIRELGEELVQQLTIVQSADWRLRLMQLLPAALASDEVDINTIDDVLIIVDEATFTPSQADREFVQGIIDNITVLIPDVREARVTGLAPDGEQITVNALDTEGLFADLQRRKGGKPIPLFNIQSMTTNELTSAIRSSQVYSLPTGISVDEAMEALRAEGMDQESIDRVLVDIGPQIAGLVDALRESQARLSILRTEARKFAGGEIDSKIDAALWAQALQRPLVAVMKPFEYWHKYVIAPLAGGVLLSSKFAVLDSSGPIGGTVVALRNLMGVDGETDRELRRHFDVARSEGENLWNALSYVREEWDGNGAQKLFLDIAVDPLTYFGFGLYAKPFRALPHMGRFANAIGAVERGYMRAAELPFTILKDMWIRTIPRTLEQRGLSLGQAAVDSIRSYVETISGRRLINLEPEEMVRMLDSVIDDTLREPQNPTTRTGIFLLGDRELSIDDLNQFIRDVDGVTVITPAHLDAVANITELTNGFGVTRWLQKSEAADALMKALDIVPSPENRIRALAYMDSLIVSLKAGALRKIRGKTSMEILGNALRGVQDDFVRAQRSLIVRGRYQQGIIAKSLDHMDALVRASHIGVIDQYVTRPFAKAYLLFGAYGLFNVFETAIKTQLAGISPLWKSSRNLYRKNSVRFFGRRAHVPLDVLRQERLIIEANFPERAFTNLSPGVQLTAAQRREAEDVGRNWVTDLVTARWLKNIPLVGRPLTTLSGYDAASVFQGAAKANYYGGMYDKLLTEADEEAVKAVVNIVNKIMPDISQFVDARYIQDYKNEVGARLLTGYLKVAQDTAIDFAPATVHSAEVAKILEPLDQIVGDIGDILMQKTNSGEIWATGPAGITRLFNETLTETIFARYLTSPELFKIMFSDFVDDVINWVPVTAAELNFKMNTIDQVVQTYGESIANAVNTARIYGERQTNPVVKEEFYTNFWANRLSPHVNQSADDIGRMINDMRSKLSTNVLGMEPIQQQQYMQLLDKQLEVIAFTRNARNQQRAIETQLLNATPRRQRDQAWWDRYYYERGLPWQNVEDEFLKVRSQTFEISTQIEGLTAPFKLNQRLNRPLVSKDISDLFGVAPSELARNMYLPELLSLRTKKSFRELVRSRADSAGREAGKTADDLGYTVDAVNKIHDQLVREIKSNPDALYGIEPALNQLENARQELIRLGGNRRVLVNDETTRYLDDVLSGKKEIVEQVSFDEHSLDSKIATQSDIDILKDELNARVLNDLDIINEAIRRNRTPPIRLMKNERGVVGTTQGNIPLTQAEIRKEWVDIIGDPDNLIVGESALIEDVVAFTPEQVTDLANRFPLITEAEITSNRWNTTALEIIQATRESAPGIESLVRNWFTRVDNSDLQRLGMAASNEMLYRAKMQAILREKFPTGFVKIFRGKSKFFGKGVEDADVIGTRQFVNVSSSRDIAENFQAFKWGGPDVGEALDIQDVIVRVDDIVAIASVTESELVIPANILRDRIANPIDLPSRIVQPATESRLAELRRLSPGDPDVQVLNRIMGSDDLPTQQWDTQLDNVMDDVNLRYGQDFPDYDNLTAFSAMMRTIFPFWTYEAHRFAWYLPREALRHPGTYTAFGKYRDNTDQGYTHIPGTSLDINPLRGTILMGGMRRLSNRDYPEFYDQFGPAAGAFDQVSRAGFFPGAPIGMIFSTFGASTGITQFGELAPAWTKTVLGSIATLAPGSKFDDFNKHILPDRFRDFMTAREVSRMGGEGVKVLQRRLLNEELTDEEQAQWDAAQRGIGWFTMLAEQTALFRFNPQERIEVNQAADELLSELTGVDVADLRDLRRKNLRFEDVFGPLDPRVQKAVFALEGFSKWTGGSVVLMPSQLGQRVLIQREFWAAIVVNREVEKANMAQFESELRLGQRSMADWLRERGKSMERNLNFIESLKLQPRYREVPMDIDSRVAFSQANKLPEPILSPLEELRELYFAEPLKERFNYETGQYEQDWDSFFAYRNAIEQSLPGDLLADLIDLNQLESTELELVHYDVNRNLFRPYHALFDIVLDEFDTDEQALIKEHRDTDTIRAQEIQEETTTNTISGEEQSLVSEFTRRLQQAHSNIREANPELDAWLNVFREVRGFKTDIAEQRTIAIRRELGLR